MSSALCNDAACALTTVGGQPQVRRLQIGQFKIQKIVSLDDFRSKNIDFGSLRPAVMVDNTLYCRVDRQLS